MSKASEEIDTEVNKFFDERPEPTIDKPPQQESLIGKGDDKPTEPYVPKYELSAAIKIKSSFGQPYSIPILAGEYPRDRIEECLELAIKSARFTNVLRAITGFDPDVEDEPEAKPKKKAAPKRVTTKTKTKGAK